MLGRVAAALRHRVVFSFRANEFALRDRLGPRRPDPGAERIIDASLAWLAAAQDLSPTQDGGCSRGFSLLTGWLTSYPETTGYIIPTMLSRNEYGHCDDHRDRARRMLDWLVSIQLPDGAFQGGIIGSLPKVPVTFNTGQILIGLSSGTASFGDPYRKAMTAAGDWLCNTMDADGAWRRNPTPFAPRGEKAYETHVAWGLLEAAKVAGRSDWGDAAMRNVRWALGKMAPNGWVADCCLDTPSEPLTHTLGYYLRGLLEAYLYRPDQQVLDGAVRMADALVKVMEPSGRIAGRLDRDWRATVPWVCITGIPQIAICWFMLWKLTGKQVYLDSARQANAYARSLVRVSGPREVLGGVAGSFPIDGWYCRHEYVNWAAKFLVDSNRIELGIR